MDEPIKLPLTNEYGYYEIRLESIGGLGANLCGKMIGELGALYLGLNSLSFSSYGSEKRGSPVKAYIRWCENTRPLQVNSPVTCPHLLGIFHEGLISSYPVLEGISKDSKIILNTPSKVKEAAEKYGISTGTLYCLDALSIAMECKSRINMVMLGALVKASGFIPLEMAEELCKDTIGKKYPNLIEANLTGVRLGYERTTCLELTSPTMKDTSETVSQNTRPAKADTLPQSNRPTRTDNTGAPPQNTRPAKAGNAGTKANSSMTDKTAFRNDFGKEQYVWGYRNAPIGGINDRIGSTVSNDLSPSREGYIPIFLPEKCINCGLCDSTCPDLVFQFLPGIYKEKEAMVNNGLDYAHCKGCLRCVDVCPTGALVSALERDYPEKPHEKQNRDLLPEDIAYQESGANSWITSVSYLTEKRVDGGVL